MKILSIGNSFSQDAQYYLHDIAKSMGDDFECVNLYIGGCSLETHCYHITSNEPAYDYELNGKPIRKTTLADALKQKDWDVITVQQASPLSGIASSYVPYLSRLTDYVRKTVPNAKLYFHETWAYEKHPEFIRYNFDRHEMFRRIEDAAKMACLLENLAIIPSGAVIEYLRDNENVFHPESGGLSLCRDGYHLSLDYGRYTAALVFYAVLSGRDVEKVPFAPENTNAELTEKIKNAVKAVI